MDRNRPRGPHPFLGGERGVAVGARQEVGRVAIAPVDERPLEAADAARDRDRLVDGALAEPRKASSKEPELPVGPETAVADPPPPEDVAAGRAVAVVWPVRRQHATDRVAKVGRHLLVGVEGQKPVAAGLRETEILLRGKAGPGPHDHSVRELPGDLHGLVLRLGVDHDQLVRPRHALQARAQPLLLVQRDDDDGQARVRHRTRISATDRKTGSPSSDAMAPPGAVSVRCTCRYGPLRSAEVGP